MRLSGATTSRIPSTTALRPSELRAATLSANHGAWLSTSALLTLCQIGRISLRPSSSIANSAFSSACGHSFAKKLGLSTTIPKREFDNPRMDEAAQRLLDDPDAAGEPALDTGSWAA